MPFNANFPLLTGTSLGVYTVELLFQELAYLELSNLAVAVDNGTIAKERQNQIVFLANEGLGQLHTRFSLNEETATITREVGEDLTVTLDDDVLLVTSMISSFGQPATIQTRKTPYSIHLVDRELFIPSTYMPSVTEFQVVYQKRHVLLEKITTAIDLAQQITLIPEIREALRAYIAFKVYSAMNSQDTMQIGALHKARYEQLLAELQGQGMIGNTLTPSRKFEERGFP